MFIYLYILSYLLLVLYCSYILLAKELVKRI